jgi:hypothetical protein
VQAQSLVIPVELTFEAQRILHTEYRVGTAENDINALVQMNMLPMGVKVSHWLTSSTAWFIKTNVKDGLKYFTREDDKFAMENDFDTDNAVTVLTVQLSFQTAPATLHSFPPSSILANKAERQKGRKAGSKMSVECFHLILKVFLKCS